MTFNLDKLDEAAMVGLKYADFRSLAKIVEKKFDPLLGTITMNFVPFEGTIHPYPLAFDPPLIEHATGGEGGFRVYWEKLAYAFALPDPAQFQSLPTLTDDDRLLLRRFVAVCRELASYSVMNKDSGVKLSGKKAKVDIEVQFPNSEAFRGTSVAFRQLHSGQEEASFDKAQGRLFQAIKHFPADQQQPSKGVLQQWVSTRGKLMNQLLETIVCRKAAPPLGPDQDIEFSYCNVKPQELILAFQYGDTIHFGKERENLANLLDHEANQAYYKHAVLLAITGLSHLYFGFAVLLESAMKAHT